LPAPAAPGREDKIVMKWSWKLGRIAGIDLYMHATFLILLAWVGVSHYLPRRSWADVADGILFIGAIFGIVVLHELGHALTARRFGIRTRDITLLPIGGVARLERMPDKPIQELWVALAGPAVNVVLAAVLVAVLVPAAALAALGEVQLVGGHFLSKLIYVNVVLAVFNLIPAFPMDGGRVLRALLAMRMDYVRATQIAATTGQAVAFVFGLAGLFGGNPFLVFIALFVWMGAAGEASLVQMKSALGGIPISRAMVTEFRTLGPRDSLASAVEHILAGFQQDFPVVEDDRLVGVLTRADLMRALAQRGQDARVEEVMQTEFETADPSEMAETVFARLQQCECHSLPVVRGGRVIGIVTPDNVAEFLMIQEALRSAKPPVIRSGFRV
jgi:Zn-dependent protease/predicted transcriptional regulator